MNAPQRVAPSTCDGFSTGRHEPRTRRAYPGYESNRFPDPGLRRDDGAL